MAVENPKVTSFIIPTEYHFIFSDGSWCLYYGSKIVGDHFNKIVICAEYYNHSELCSMLTAIKNKGHLSLEKQIQHALGKI